MKLSIALATCNGSKHLVEQLESFVKQSRLPDQVVACDDQSTDDTFALLQKFADTAPFPVIVHQHPQRVGIMKNFEAAAALCTGDLIFFSDQDDVWLPEKLARHEAEYAKNPDVGLVFSDGTIVDEGLKPIGQTLFGYTGVNPKRQEIMEGTRAFGLLVRRTFAYGCTMSFRAELLKALRPFPYEYLHDVWAQTVLSAISRIKVIPDPLILYRRHSSQSVGLNVVVKTDPSVERLKQIESQTKALKYLLQTLDSPGFTKPKGNLRGQILARLAYLQRRESIGSSKPSGLLAITLGMISGAYLRHGEHPLSELKSDLRQVRSGGV